MNNIVRKSTAAMLLSTVALYTMPVYAFTKEETVYTKLDSNGESYKTIVTDHISGEEDIIKDLTDLINIKNVTGDETFELNGNEIIWKTEGKDIQYQGETNKELPITCTIKYELNGVEVTKDELEGKSGKVKITIKYTNNDKHSVNINGMNETMYTPFLVGFGTIFDNKNNKNVSISNGKVINDGNKIIAVGLAFPGLQESLGLDKDKIDIPDTVEINMDTEKFEFKTGVSYVTSEVFEFDDVNISGELRDLYSNVNTLQSSSIQIKDGADSLVEGIKTYSEKSKEFNNAMSQVTNGIDTLTSNYSKIDKGIITLNEGAKELNEGANSLKNGIYSISMGAKTVDENMAKLENGGKELKSGEEKILAGINSIENAMQGISGENNTAKITQLKGLVTTNEKVINSLSKSNENLNNIIKNETDENTIKALKGQIEINNNTIKTLTYDNGALNETIKTLEQTDTKRYRNFKTRN